MGFSFWLKSNNGKSFNLESLQELIKDKGIADNPKLAKLFSLFDTDNDGKISTVNSKGEKELESIFSKFSSVAGDNQILEESEVSGYLKENNLENDLSVKDVFDFLGKFIKSNANEDVKQADNEAISEFIRELEAYIQNRASQHTMTDAEFNKIKKEAYNTVLTSTISTEKTEKDYDDLFTFAKENLSESGKTPTLEELTLYAAELQMLNPDIKADKKVKKGTSINIPAKSINKKNVEILESKGIKVEKDNFIFFQKLLELDDTKQAVVFNVIKNSKFKTKEEVINEVYNKTKINLADTGLTIKVGGVPSTLENFITKTLKLDLSSKDGLKIYNRLCSLGKDASSVQATLNSFPKEFIDKLSKMNNITFDKLADKAEVFGIILRTDEEIKEREKNSQAYRDLKARMFMAQYVADNYTSAVTISQSADRNLNFTQGAWWIRNARPIGYTSNEQQKRDTAKVNQIKKLIQDVDTLSNEEFTKKMSAIMEAERTVRDIDFSLPGEPSLPSYSKTKDPSFKFDPKLAYTFMKQMQRAELAAGVAKRLEPHRKGSGEEKNPYVQPTESTRVYNAQREIAGIEYTVEPFDKEELKQLTRYIKSIKTKKELFLFAKSLHYKVDVISNRVKTMIPKENQAEIAKLLEQKAKELGFAEPTRPNSISLDTFRNVFTKPIYKKVNYPKTNEKTIMETYEATKTKLLGNWDPVGEQIRIQEMEGTVGGVLDIATMILVTKGMGTMGTFVRIGNVGRNIGTATNFFKTASIASRWSKNATLINRLAKADKVLGGLWVNGAAGALHGAATMGAYGGLQGTVGMADNTVKNLLEGKDWSEGLGERFEQTLVMGYENAKFGLFAGYSGVLAQALGKGSVALGSKGIDKLFKTNYSKTVLDKASSVVTEEGISGSEFFTKMHKASKAEGLVGFGYETGFFTLYHKMEEAGVDFNNEESLLTYLQNNLDEETKQSLGATYLSEGGNLAMFKIIGSLIQWVHIGKLSSTAAMEIQANNNRALKNMNMRKVVENGNESYLVKFNENDKPIKVAPEQLMQLCEHKMFCADAEDKAQKDGSFKLPNNQTIEYDKAKKVYRTVIDAENTVESISVEDLLVKINQTTFRNQINGQIFKDDQPATVKSLLKLVMTQNGEPIKINDVEIKPEEVLENSETLDNVKIERTKVNGKEVYNITLADGKTIQETSLEGLMSTCESFFQLELMKSVLEKGRNQGVNEASKSDETSFEKIESQFEKKVTVTSTLTEEKMPETFEELLEQAPKEYMSIEEADRFLGSFGIDKTIMEKAKSVFPDRYVIFSEALKCVLKYDGEKSLDTSSIKEGIEALESYDDKFMHALKCINEKSIKYLAEKLNTDEDKMGLLMLDDYLERGEKGDLVKIYNLSVKSGVPISLIKQSSWRLGDRYDDIISNTTPEQLKALYKIFKETSDDTTVFFLEEATNIKEPEKVTDDFIKELKDEYKKFDELKIMYGGADSNPIEHLEKMKDVEQKLKKYGIDLSWYDKQGTGNRIPFEDVYKIMEHPKETKEFFELCSDKLKDEHAAKILEFIQEDYCINNYKEYARLFNTICDIPGGRRIFWELNKILKEKSTREDFDINGVINVAQAFAEVGAFPKDGSAHDLFTADWSDSKFNPKGLAEFIRNLKEFYKNSEYTVSDYMNCNSFRGGYYNEMKIRFKELKEKGLEGKIAPHDLRNIFENANDNDKVERILSICDIPLVQGNTYLFMRFTRKGIEHQIKEFENLVNEKNPNYKDITIEEQKEILKEMGARLVGILYNSFMYDLKSYSDEIDIDKLTKDSKYFAREVFNSKNTQLNVKEKVQIIRATIDKPNILDLASRVWHIEDFPFEHLGNILDNITDENISIAERLCFDKECNKKNIPSILKNLVSSNFEIFLQYYETREDFRDFINNSNISDININLLIEFLPLKGKNDLSELTKTEKKAILLSILKHKSDFQGSYKQISQILPENGEEYAKVIKSITQSLNISFKPLEASSQRAFDENLKNLTNVLRTIDLSELQEIQLSMSHSEFILQVQSILKDLSMTEQAKIQDYFGFKIIGGKLSGYPNSLERDLSISNITDKKSIEALNKVKKIVDNYVNNNFITVKNNPVLNEQLKTISKYIPEFFNQVDGTSLPVSTIKALQKVLQNPYFNTLSESDKKVMVIATLLHNTDKISGTTSESAFDAYFIAKRLNMSNQDAKKIYIIVESSDLIDKFMKTSKKQTIRDYRGTQIIGSEREDVFDLLAFNLKESNLFEMAQMLYSTKEQEGLTRYLDKALKSRIQEIKSNDFILPQTSISEYMSHAKIEIIERDGKEYKIKIVKASDIPNFYALIHTPEAGYATGGSRDANFANFEIFKDFYDDKVICTSYIGNHKAGLVKEFHNGFIFNIKNDKQYVGYGTDIFSLGKNIPDILVEYYRPKGIEANRGRGYKYDHRQLISSAIKSNLFGKNYFTMFSDFIIQKNEIMSKYATEINNLNIKRKQLIQEKTGSKNVTRAQYESVKNEPDIKACERQIKELEQKMNNEIQALPVYKELLDMDTKYIERMENIKQQLGEETLTIERLEEIDPEIASAYKDFLDNNNENSSETLLKNSCHNEVLVSNPEIIGIFTDDIEKIPEEYLIKAQEENLPIVVIK